MRAKFRKGALLPNLQEYFGVNAVFLFWLSGQPHCLRLSAQRCVLQLRASPQDTGPLCMACSYPRSMLSLPMQRNVHYTKCAFLRATLRLRSSIFEFVIIKCGLISVEEPECGLSALHMFPSANFFDHW